jgi:FkbM family methyltransferase
MLAIVMRQNDVVVRRQGVKMMAKIGSGQGLYCAVAGTSYESEMRYFLSLMAPGDTFIDVGANIGCFSLHACRRVKSHGNVYAFEPLQANFDMLISNIRLNGATNIAPFKVALSDQEGTFTMHVPSRESSAVLVHTQGEVVTETLDGFYARHGWNEPQFIKVDIEGGELGFFRGAEQTLRRSKPAILFESMHSGPEFPERSFLRSIGFELYRVDGRATTVLTNDCLWSGNVLAIKV